MKVLEMKGISKSFFGVNVLSAVDFDVEKGEVHALLGENGAGKSTLMNILAGVHNRDTGSVVYEGKRLEQITVKRTEEAGIVFVHQELNLFNDLKVYENIFLQKEITNKFGVLNKKKMIEQTKELFNQLGVEIDATALVDNLETSKKQLVEIAKALHTHAKLIILDEPTTSLNNAEIEHLFAIVNRLKKQGCSFIFISHKMTEIFALADRYTVLRNGKKIHTGLIGETNPAEVTKLMVGKELHDNKVYEHRTLGEPILELDKLSGEGFSNVTLRVKKGEIVGFTGLKASGVSEMMQTIFGVSPIRSGTVTICGNKFTKTTIKKSMQGKLAMLPANRKENSVIQDFSLLENYYVSEHTLSKLKQLIQNKAETQKFLDSQKKLSIKAESPRHSIVSLSGGNQQKVILARWLNTQAEILMLDNPTQGVDVGAKAEIYKLIVELSKSGKTILVNTLEIPEIQKIADRCVIFYHGELKAEIDREDITEQRVMMYATNAIQANANVHKGE